MRNPVSFLGVYRLPRRVEADPFRGSSCAGFRTPEWRSYPLAL